MCGCRPVDNCDDGSTYEVAMTHERVNEVHVLEVRNPVELKYGPTDKMSILLVSRLYISLKGLP